MGLLGNKLHQTITYWPHGGIDADGSIVFGPPAEIMGRWDEVQEVYATAAGQERRSKAKVLVDQELTVNGYLMIGTSTETDPRALADAFPINSFNRYGNVQGNDYVREAIL